MFRARRFRELEKKLGYKFRDEEKLACALTHASARGAEKSRVDNERLEFIGDRVLGLVIAEFLSKAFPDANEGELARRFNRLVRGECCARVGRNVGLGPFLILSDSEAVSGGRDKDTILADAVEAVLGAVFLDGGFEKSRAVVHKVWVDLDGAHPKAAADPKSALQEWAQGRGLPLPRYFEVSREGPDHAPRFISEVRIESLPPSRGEGASKRIAEQAAAQAMLEREGVRKPGSEL